VSFFVPESVVADATKEWWEAGCKVREFRERGYEWSMTHSFFAEMGGFVYANRDDEGTFKLVTMDSLKFLELCEEDKIANPMIMVEDIKDKSKSDTLGKAILAVQLLWFTLQVAVRVQQRLTVTLVELDTVCMAVLTLLLLLIWKDKPLRPERPHIFYSPQEVTQLQEMDLVKLSQKYWKSEPSCLYELMAWFGCRRKTPSNPNKQKPRLLKLQQLLEVEVAGFSVLSLLSFCVTGIIFGGLHLTAWNFDFGTDAEKKAWRVASLILAGAPLAMIVFCLTLALRQRQESTRRSGGTRVYLGIALILLSRLILLGLMFASLRSMPCSAHRNVIWTLYVPHI